MPHFPLSIHNFKTASSADVDILHDEIYWTNKLEGKIFRAPLAGGYRHAVVWLDLMTPEAIVIDEIGQKMYWVDSGTSFIEVADLNGPNRKVLIEDGITQVTSLALDLQTQ